MPDQHPITASTFLGIQVHWRDFFTIRKTAVVPCTHAEADNWPYCPVCGVKQDENHEETVYVGEYRTPAVAEVAETYSWGDPQTWEVDWTDEEQVEDYFRQSISARFPSGVGLIYVEGISILGVEIDTITRRSKEPRKHTHMDGIITREGQIADAAKSLDISGRPVCLYTVRFNVE
ncbi:MAG: hypothetical protein ACYTFG_10795 [Planctomycetota bacterium]|jgi:hypothetical protein